MKTDTPVEILKQRKQEWIKYFEDLENSYKEGRITKQEFLDTEHKILKGQFKEDFLKHIENEIKRQETQRNKKRNTKIIAATLAFFILAFAGMQSGITGLVTLGEQTNAILPINQEYKGNTTEDLTFIETTSLKVSGKIYGKGQTWIYLTNNQTQRLVYYADTNTPNTITGLITGTPHNEAINTTVAETKANNTTTNQTTNETNQTVVNETTNETTNLTLNETNNTTTTNPTVNETNTTANKTNTTLANTTTANNTKTNSTVMPEPIVPELFEPRIVTSRSTYNIGDNVSYEILPKGATGTIYLHAPSNSYILNEFYWIAQEDGNHTLSGLITLGNNTERTETSFNVQKQETATITEACVETCTMQETPVTLLIITQGTTLKLESITYTPTSNATNQTNKTKPTQIIKTLTIQENTTQEPIIPQDPRAFLNLCLDPNPNNRPKDCFTTEAWNARFPQNDYKLVNKIGMPMARIDYLGNMHIKGVLIENSLGNSQNFDFVVKRNDETEAAWIDAITGDLYIRGEIVENQETLMWKERKDYVISNPQGMYMAIFFSETGDLHLRGKIIQGGAVN